MGEGGVIMLKEQFKKILINLGSKIVKYLDISICLSFLSASINIRGVWALPIILLELKASSILK